MLDATRKLQQFAAGTTRNQLDSDLKLTWAICRGIEIIGEAASRMSNETRAASPRIPWSSVIGMRNILIHAYFDIDLDQVWETLTQSLPRLEEELEDILSANEE